MVLRSSANIMAKKSSTATIAAATKRAVKARATTKSSTRRRASSGSDFEADSDNQQDDAPKAKRRKVAGSESKAQKLALFQRVFGDRTDVSQHSCSIPLRAHSMMYHRPLLLDAPISLEAKKAQESLLSWFDDVRSDRSMPWRKPWIDPASVLDPLELRQLLERRAYEVWISEIMLQQTRVAVVIDYWNRWTTKWPTIQGLAAADGEDVLAAWRGLGYYSRATRIHEAAKLIVDHPDMKGLIPENVATLVADVPGIGPYTAGAISAIVFGRAEPLVDGNVLRVLSRQLGLLGNVKSDKMIIDALWAAAAALVKDVALGGGNDPSSSATTPPKSDRPGRWGQALMELGSTVCTPKPNCSACPITSTCRVYQEGDAIAKDKRSTATTSSPVGTNEDSATKTVDIEDLCSLCESFEDAAADGDEVDEAVEKKGREKQPAKGAKQGSKGQAKLTAFAFTSKTSRYWSSSSQTPSKEEAQKRDDVIVSHARKFPLKVAKKAVKEEATLVCAIWRRADGRFLIRRRPATGLLAGLWEFPSQAFDDTQQGNGSTAKDRKALARTFVLDDDTLLSGDQGKKSLKHVGELGNVPWLFSHLKLTMYVHLFTVEDDGEGNRKESGMSRWSDDIEQESMGTGMRKCWFMVKDAMGRVIED